MDLEIYELRIFCQVMMDKTFSRAAVSLRITQPAVSQKIAKLEKQLQGRLFERVGHDLIPTRLAGELYGFASHLVASVDEFGAKLQNARSLPCGVIRYAMPESCQWTPHYRKIMSQIARLPEMRFRIEILPNDLIIKGVLEGRIDFGFVVGERLAPELRFQKFSTETYSAVAKDQDLLKPLQKSGEISKLRLITYPGWELFFTQWAKAHGIWGALKSRLPEPSVQIGTLAGAIHAIQEGAGTGIIPSHCIAKDLANGRVHEWCPSKAVSAANPVYLARRLGERPPRRVELVMEMLLESKTGVG